MDGRANKASEVRKTVRIEKRETDMKMAQEKGREDKRYTQREIKIIKTVRREG